VNLDAVLRVLSRKQLRSVMECTARINAWHGAVSSGKTIASTLAFLFALVRAPENGLIFIVGRTLQTVERNVIDVLMQSFGPFGPFSRYVKHTRGADTATIFGRTVYLIGAHNVLAEGRIRGATASLILVDEATLIGEDFFTMCLSRLRVPGAKLLLTTNPDSPQHWLRQKFLLRPELNLRQWQFQLDDNPFLAEDYKNNLKAEYSGLFYRRFIAGDWCLAEGAIYDSWDPERHLVDDESIAPITRWLALGVDYGTVNPFAAELLGLGADGRLYLVDEYYYDSKISYRQLTDHEYSAALREWLDRVHVPHSRDPAVYGVRPQWTVIDPSAASFRLQLHKDGVTSTLADNAVLDGIRTVSALLSTGRLRVHRRCKGFIGEVPGYSWDPKAAQRGEDAPIKAADHALDGCRYGVFTTRAAWQNQLCAPNTDLRAPEPAAPDPDPAHKAVAYQEAR
jgi:PBSX family phage terminase large subunit